MLNAASRPARKAAMFCSTIFLSLGSENALYGFLDPGRVNVDKGRCSSEKHEIGTADGGYALGLFIHVESHNAGADVRVLSPHGCHLRIVVDVDKRLRVRHYPAFGREKWKIAEGLHRFEEIR